MAKTAKTPEIAPETETGAPPETANSVDLAAPVAADETVESNAPAPMSIDEFAEKHGVSKSHRAHIASRLKRVDTPEEREGFLNEFASTNARRATMKRELGWHDQ